MRRKQYVTYKKYIKHKKNQNSLENSYLPQIEDI